MSTIESVEAKVDRLADRILEYHEDIRREREKDRLDARELKVRVENHDDNLEKLLRKNSPPPSSLRTGAAPFDAKKIVQVGAGILAVLGALGTAIAQTVETRQESARTRESAEKSAAESRNELLRALVIVSRSAQSQAKSAEALASPDPATIVEAEREAVSVAQRAVEVEHDLVQRQIQAAPSPAKRLEAERSLADVRVRARKVGAEL